MHTVIHQKLVPSLLVRYSCFVFLLCVFSYVPQSFAQEDALSITEDAQATSTALTATSSPDDVVERPYTIERLEGNEIYGDFVVGPGKIELALEPGESKTVEITVSNRTGTSRTFKISAEDAEGSQDPSQALVLLGDDRGPYSMKDYVSVPHTSFELAHNERARVPVTITLPTNVEPGGRYGSVLVETVTAPAEQEGAGARSAVVARIGTLFFITVAGATAHEGSLKEFSTIPNTQFFQDGPISFGVLYENTGSMHLAPYGEIRIYNLLGEEVGFVELKPWFVLPKAIRLREVSWERELLFGRYTAVAKINRSYDDVIDTKEIHFWVLPWKPLALIFIGVFGVLFLIRLFFKRFEFKRKT